MRLRTRLAVLVCKASGAVLRKLGRGGTNLPGKLALKIDKNILGELSRNFVSPTICVLTSQNTSRPKVPIRKLSPSRSIKTEVHAPGFYEIAPQFLFYARCRAYVLIFSNSRPFGRLFLYLYAFSLTFSGLPPRAGPERISAIFR